MPWIPLYADAVDVRQILNKLNTDLQIAFVVNVGKNKWATRPSVEQLPDGTVLLWHMPGGPLPLFAEGKTDVLGRRFRKLFGVRQKMLESAGTIPDPFNGWTGPHVSCQPTIPFLGGEPNQIELKLRMVSPQLDTGIGLSSFGWIGNRYRAIGHPAAKETENWWRRLRGWVVRSAAERIPRSGPLDGSDKEIWAFPSAFKRFQAGVQRAVNPF